MKIFGLLAVLIGIAWLIVSLFIDTTNGTQFNNIGLLFSQFESIVTACFILLCGVVLFSTAVVIDAISVNHKAHKDSSQCDASGIKEPGPIERKVKAFGEKLSSYEIK